VQQEVKSAKAKIIERR